MARPACPHPDRSWLGPRAHGGAQARRRQRPCPPDLPTMAPHAHGSACTEAVAVPTQPSGHGCAHSRRRLRRGGNHAYSAFRPWPRTLATAPAQRQQSCPPGLPAMAAPARSGAYAEAAAMPALLSMAALAHGGAQVATRWSPRPSRRRCPHMPTASSWANRRWRMLGPQVAGEG